MVTKTEPIRPPPLPGIFGVPGSGSRIAWEPVPHNTRQKSGPVREPAEKIVKDLRRMTRRKFSAEEKIRIVLEGLRGEEGIAELCRREGIVQNLYYRWSKDFLEAGKKRLAGDTARAATSDEVKDLRREASALKEVVAELTLENRLLKKSVTGDGEDEG
jgi:transposase